MQKLLNHRIYVILLTLAFCIGITFWIRSCVYTKEVRAVISPFDVEPGMPVSFADSTQGARHWLWEFGNGESSPLQSGTHIFSESGKYQIRLTVNGELEKKFLVTVRSKVKSDQDEIVRINAPTSALQGEYITFRGEGPSQEWRWEFGESGKVDAHEKNTIYRYELPGQYTVSLRTEETKYPVLHTITIIPQYSDNDSTDVSSIIGNDIKEKLQAIVDQKPFNTNYNYVLKKYLCGDSNTLVVVNNNKKNDFYSYCQGLKIIGRKKVKIENVLVTMEAFEECISKIIVIQTDLE
ncbi:PKD domain-containing protein [Bacteroides sp. 224]|uniref:PKD domain-containing protein n=1 Tax=Bacteroides sp. 224 TaxID=2302936 RepID=UPI0013D314C9|nr:PKD domain-containing protein [Bacteroides sp. 224]NDV65223.1 PKD domain-containing protein [Bacteroides sp. 224]